MSPIKLKSMDDDVFEVDVSVAKMLGTVRNMIEELGVEYVANEVIPINTVSTEVLHKVLVWAEYYKSHPVQDVDEHERVLELTGWDQEFFRVDQMLVFELIAAANYLDVPKLLNCACKAVANMLKGKTPEEIRKEFNIENDLSTSELLQIFDNNEWFEDEVEN